MLDSLGDVSDDVRTHSGPIPKKIAVMSAAFLGVILVLGASFGAGFAVAQPVTLPVEEEVLSEQVAPGSLVTRPQPESSLSPQRIRTCSLGLLPLDPELGSFAGIVLEPQGGEVLFARGDDREVAPASVMKLITAASALLTLGPEARFETKVVSSSQPGVVVLVGGGDPTLSTLPGGAESVYVGAPKLQTLAEQTVASVGASLAEGEVVSITEVVLDLSLWDTQDEWDASWSPDARANGFISQVTPLQVDGDRRNPAAIVSARSDDASERAGQAFVEALKRAGNTARTVSISRGVAEPGAIVLASVFSQPVSALSAYMVKESDNTLAEVLARHVSVAVGLGGQAQTVNQALTSSLAGRGLPLEGVTLRDGSGLSSLNRVKPQYVAALLLEMYHSGGNLALVRQSLPVAGVDGSLKDRFAGPNAGLVGKVAAKTGTIKGVRALAGYVSASDDTDLIFAFFATGDVGEASRVAIETLVTGVYTCGENLAHF